MKEKIESLSLQGYTYQQIGEKLGISRQRVHQILTGYKTLPQSKTKTNLLSQKCSSCDKKTEHVHHRDKNSHNNESNNLLPLCLNCHVSIHCLFDKILPGSREEKKIRNMRLKGYSLSEMSREVNISRSVLYKILHRLGMIDYSKGKEPTF